MCEREEDEFGNMCECMLALVTHVAACVQLLFDRSCLQEVLGNVFMQEKEMAVSYVGMGKLERLREVVEMW